MGMSFLRNVYAVMNYGDWVDGSSDTADPFIQLLPTTNVQDAHNDFVTVRMGGVDSTSNPEWELLPVSEEQHSPLSANEKKEQYEEMILSRWPEIFVGCLAFVLIVTGIIIWRCCCRKGRKNRGCCCCGGRNKANARELALEKDMAIRGPKSDSYLPLQEGTLRYNASTASFNNNSTASLHGYPGYGSGQGYGGGYGFPEPTHVGAGYR